MTIIRSNLGRGYEPQTQADIVEAQFAREDTKIAVFKAGDLPALGEDFDNEDQFAAFVTNTLRMRPNFEWQYTECDGDRSNLKWRNVVATKSARRMTLHAYGQKAADILFSQETCVGIRISYDKGIEAAFTNEVPPKDATLVLTYRLV